MNDQDRFIWNVASPYMPARPRPGAGRTSRSRRSGSTATPPTSAITAGLDKAIEPATVPFIETSLEWQLFDDLTYDLPHTLPFVCDQVLTFPRSTALMLVGDAAGLRLALRQGLAGHGLHRPDPGAARNASGLPTDLAGVETRAVRRAALRRPSCSSSSSALPPRRRPSPSATGREIAADRQAAAQGRRAAVQAGRRDRGRDASRRAGACRAASSAST